MTRPVVLTRTAVVDVLARAVARSTIERLRHGEYVAWLLDAEESDALEYALEDTLRSVLGDGRKG